VKIRFAAAMKVDGLNWLRRKNKEEKKKIIFFKERRSLLGVYHIRVGSGPIYHHKRKLLTYGVLHTMYVVLYWNCLKHVPTNMSLNVKYIWKWKEDVEFENSINHVVNGGSGRVCNHGLWFGDLEIGLISKDQN